MIYNFLNTLTIVFYIAYIVLWIIGTFVLKRFSKTYLGWMIAICLIASLISLIILLFGLSFSRVFNALIWILVTISVIICYKKR